MAVFVIDSGKPAGELHSREVGVVWVSPTDAANGITAESLWNKHSDYSEKERAEFVFGGVWEMPSFEEAQRFADYRAADPEDVIYINRY